MNAAGQREWLNYELANRRAAYEYATRPSIVPLLVDSLAAVGVGRTARRFNMHIGSLVAMFPDLIERHPSGSHARLRLILGEAS